MQLQEISETAGYVRVAFENRSAWNAELVIENDQEAVLMYYGATEKQNRKFVLASDHDGDLVCETKPAWGKLTALKAR